MDNASEKFSQARRQHQAGNLEQAERLYREILGLDPGYAPALHLMGIAAYQRGENRVALDFIRRAIAADPEQTAFHSNLGLVHQRLSNFDQAITSYREALKLNQDSIEALINLGNVLAEVENYGEAEATYQRALSVHPNHVGAHTNLGKTLNRQGKRGAAVASFRRALEIAPNHAEARQNLARVLVRQGDHEQAEAVYRGTLEIDDTDASAHFGLGGLLRVQGSLRDARFHFQRAVELDPDYAEAHSDLGAALLQLGQVDDALARFRRALEIKPHEANLNYNLGTALAWLGRHEEALASYDRALLAKADHAGAHLNRAMTWLLTERWDLGWTEYEWRWQEKLTLPPFRQPRWTGESSEGKRILLCAEQGLGDVVQFSRYASVLKPRFEEVILRCHPPLVKLLKTCAGVDRVLDPSADLPEFDVFAPLLSLPAILKTTPESVPAGVPYLAADRTLSEAWMRRLAEYEGCKIGICWQGNPEHQGDCFRSIPLEHFASLIRVPNVKLISLQKGHGVEQLQKLGDRVPIVDFGEELDGDLDGDLDGNAGPFMDTSAIMKDLDLVITSDTVTAHLAGALGVPVWVVLAYAPDWRWLLDRPDSPWYPTMRLFRQPKFGDWEGVFDQVREALREYVCMAESSCPGDPR